MTLHAVELGICGWCASPHEHRLWRSLLGRRIILLSLDGKKVSFHTPGAGASVTVTREMAVAKEELFGPSVTVGMERFRSRFDI